MEELCPHLYRIEMPLPGSPLGWVNSYVIKDPDRNLIIDTGLNRKECFEAMQAGLSQVGVDLGKTDFYITHMHADHFALAQSLFDGNTTVYMNQPDKEHVEDFPGWESFIEYGIRNGFPREEVTQAVFNHPGYKYGSDRIPPMKAVEDGDVLRVGGYSFRAVATPGHTQGHTCLYEPERKLLLSGDHLLIDITPNIACWVEEDNPLRSYLESLEKVYGLEVEQVLPGHRRLWKDHRGRIEELKEHHRIRLQEVLSILENGSSDGYQVASRMTWDIDCNSWADYPVSQKWFATGEALAHLRYLQEEGKAVREERDGCMVYSLRRG